MRSITSLPSPGLPAGWLDCEMILNPPVWERAISASNHFPQ